ncbi:MAG: TolC family protein [Gammaproteobacteria bacterium]|nr:TolC family protein [Gammaproteobacteria bacterium]
MDWEGGVAQWTVKSRWRALLAMLVVGAGCVVAPPSAAGIFQGLWSDPLSTQDLAVPGPGQVWARRPQGLPKTQSPPPVTFAGPMSLAALTAFALAHNPATRVAFANLQAAAYGLGVADSAYFPTLTFADSATRTQANTTAGFAIPIQNVNSGALSLSYVLLDFGARAAQREQALAQIYVSGFDNNSALQAVALAVTQNYYQLIGQQALVRAYRQTVREDQASLDAARIKQQSGLATISDVLQARAALAQAQSDWIAAQAQMRADMGGLAESCGLPADETVPVMPLDVSEMPPLVAPSLRSLIRRAQQNNPGILASSAQILASRATVQADEAAGLPSIVVTGTAGKRFQASLGPSQNWSVSVNVRVPIFGGFKDTYQIQQARAGERSAQASLAEETQKIDMMVYQDYETVLGARAAAGAARLAVQSARASLTAIKAQYKVGLATMLAVLTAQAALTTAEQTAIQDVTTAYVQLANLADALGYIGLPAQAALKGAS